MTEAFDDSGDSASSVTVLFTRSGVHGQAVLRLTGRFEDGRVVQIRSFGWLVPPRSMSMVRIKHLPISEYKLDHMSTKVVNISFSSRARVMPIMSNKSKHRLTISQFQVVCLDYMSTVESH